MRRFLGKSRKAFTKQYKERSEIQKKMSHSRRDTIKNREYKR